MLTNKDIDELLMMAEMEAEDDVQAALAEFYRPDVEMEAADLWADMEPGLKQLVRQRAPEQAKRMDEILGKGR